MVLCLYGFKISNKKNADGTLKLGLIDSINKLIKDNNTGSTYTDDPYDVTTPFNKVVKDITGYDCIESLRKKYVEELKAGTWTFKGFGNATECEILTSNDGQNWTSVDYQNNNNNASGSYNIGTQKARYVMIKVFTPDNGVGTLRLYDFQLYNK